MKSFLQMMALPWIATLWLLQLASADYSDSLQWNEWKEFKATYNKVYAHPKEEDYRFHSWRKNAQVISSFNRNVTQSKNTFSLKNNKFSDMSDQHFEQNFLAARPGYHGKASKVIRRVSRAEDLGIPGERISFLPDYVDWSMRGYVSDVRDQGACSSSYAFAGLGAVEGQFFNKTGKLVPLSAQNIVDCSSSVLSYGCNGGTVDNTLDYIMAMRGVNTWDDYPYTGQQSKCHFNRTSATANVGGYVILAGLNETLLQIAVATVGPIAVTMDGSSPYFRFYETGVLYDPICKCSYEHQNHAVLVVGYGTTAEGNDYWIIKNSWGTDWGMDGYAHLARNQDNMCGLTIHPQYPDVLP